MSTPNEDACPKPKGAEAMQEALTARIIQDLREGVPTWVKPWASEKNAACVAMPTNVISGRPYTGCNVLQLWATAMERQYSSHAWLTFKQAGEIGARIKKGEKATPVIFVNFQVRKDDRNKPEKEQRKIPFMRVYSCFNLAQLDGVPAAYIKPPPVLPPSEYRLAAVRFAHDTGVFAINFGCQAACYRPKPDTIDMPDLKRFVSEEAFSGTLAHELVHSTGHESRLARKFGKRFGDEDYKFEELVAELGSAFLCAQMGIPPTTRTHASYIDYWIKQLENDYTLLTTAASYASAAVAYMTAQVEARRNHMAAAE